MATASSFFIENYRKELFPYAYNILGLVHDAEDVVQEVMLNWQLTEHGKVENPRAYLVRSVINRAINLKEKNRNERANYVGPWLPEPVFTDHVEDRLDSKKVLTYSILLLLEQLNGKERAVFILRECFDYTHAEIAAALDITDDNSRQLLKRAKAKVGPLSVQPEQWQNQMGSIEQFMQAIMNGDTDRVEQMLTADATFISDSNGKVSAARNILHGAEVIRKFLVGVFTKHHPETLEVKFVAINHQPAIAYYQYGELLRCTIFELLNGQIVAVHSMMNPEKLEGLKKYPILSRP